MNWLDSALSAAKSVDSSRPLVTLSYAQSLDGSIAARQGKALTLSGKASFRMTHYLRSIHDAILVGIGTVLADNPQLTVREVDGDNPRPVVLDSALRTPLDARLFAQTPMPWVFTADLDGKDVSYLETQGAEVLQVDQDEAGFLRLDEILLRLGERGIHTLMVEGGAQIIQAFLSQGLADQLILTVSPSFVGGYKAVDALIESEFPQVQEPQITLLENDIIVWGALS
ncbi:MAG: GTP cyclohydrolase [Chloroflexi bacterium]|nr:MAG: GTP cyclohydrolase [Chloroflexota bacterium]MBL1193368.1 GTP cyclohydrolase [Chloroflexota bacterium]NOH10660.1 GTP cyclohydrolase [Chloroflexota bacterium]